MAVKKMYRVEKFVPEQCPNCDQPFRWPKRDFVLYLGEIVDGQRVPFQHDLHDIIICVHCKKRTARVMLEAVRVFDQDLARALVQESGFTAFYKGLAEGTHAEKPDQTLYPLGYGALAIAPEGRVQQIDLSAPLPQPKKPDDTT